MKNKLFDIANAPQYGYINRALGKISRLALAGYQVNGAQPTITSGFFVRNISMRSHVMAKLERDIFGCAGNHLRQSANPFQLCHLYLAVIGKASFKVNGAHSHA